MRNQRSFFFQIFRPDLKVRTKKKSLDQRKEDRLYDKERRSCVQSCEVKEDRLHHSPTQNCAESSMVFDENAMLFGFNPDSVLKGEIDISVLDNKN